MSAIKFTICVVRSIAPGVKGYVPAEEVDTIDPTEMVYFGQFNHTVNEDDASAFTVCTPVGVQPHAQLPCVLREVSGQMEYVPTNEVPSITVGERIFAGPWKTQIEKHGPSGSHSRTICTPAVRPIELRVAEKQVERQAAAA